MNRNRVYPPKEELRQRILRTNAENCAKSDAATEDLSTSAIFGILHQPNGTATQSVGTQSNGIATRSVGTQSFGTLPTAGDVPGHYSCASRRTTSNAARAQLTQALHAEAASARYARTNSSNLEGRLFEKSQLGTTDKAKSSNDGGQGQGTDLRFEAASISERNAIRRLLAS